MADIIRQNLYFLEDSAEFVEVRKKNNDLYVINKLVKTPISESCEPINTIKFQKGVVEEVHVNGCREEDLISIVIDRLETFQKTKSKSKDYDMAIIKLQEALLWLENKTAFKLASRE